MITIRDRDSRGHADHGWLDTRHTFSFGTYRDSRYDRFRSLRVLNEDRVQPGKGFGTHGHRDMEILSYVLEGSLEHRDSMGNGSVIPAGTFQKMSAGRGVEHSEFNPSPTDPTHLYQIWLLPSEKGIEPAYHEADLAGELAPGTLRLIASPDAREGSLPVHQDALLYLARLDPGKALSYELAPGRHAWVQVTRGEVRLEGKRLRAGDGAAVSGEPSLSFESETPGEILLFDLA